MYLIHLGRAKSEEERQRTGLAHTDRNVHMGGMRCSNFARTLVREGAYNCCSSRAAAAPGP